MNRSFFCYNKRVVKFIFFFFQAEDGIRDKLVTGVQTCALPISGSATVRRTVATTAARHGVDPQLALAVSWQESGWQMDRRSDAGAIGAMQVLPSTAAWMSPYAGHRLHLHRLADNAVAGVQ